jgi:hypothetical protein
MYEGGITETLIIPGMILPQDHKCLSQAVMENEYAILYWNREIIIPMKINHN